MKKLGFGLMRLPLLNANDAGSIDIELLKEMIDEYIKRGFTYFDTAWMYCNEKSETAAKEALVSRYPRDSFTLTSKLPGYMINRPQDCDKIFNIQREKTGVEFFDYYLLHDVNNKTYDNFVKQGCFQWIRDKKEQGLIKKIGFSFHGTPELLEEILSKYPYFEFVQLQINYLDWKSLGIQSEKCYSIARKYNKPIFVMEPVKGGTLAKVSSEVETLFKSHDSSMSIPSWGIRFAASLEGVEIVLSGMSDMDQLLDNTDYMSDFKPLTEEEKNMCLKAAEIINNDVKIPCTGCSYCTVNCPKNIAIPKYFSLYNADMQELKEKHWTPQISYYLNLTESFGKASDCVKCGQCEAHCPQSLEIRKYLETVAEHFEQ